MVEDQMTNDEIRMTHDERPLVIRASSFVIQPWKLAGHYDRAGGFFIQARLTEAAGDFGLEIFEADFVMSQQYQHVVNQVGCFIDNVAAALFARFAGGLDQFMGLFGDFGADFGVAA
jgi:hypothetical protein